LDEGGGVIADDSSGPSAAGKEASEDIHKSEGGLV
jgi:hypothetical protein